MIEWVVKPCKARELAKLYQVSYKVFLRHLKPHLKEIGPRLGHFYMMHQVIMIIDIMGAPPFGVKFLFPHIDTRVASETRQQSFES
ncbi:MAG TPA: hypothetical protein VIM65_12805 [Cyclobacteriaceae bacterium]